MEGVSKHREFYAEKNLSAQARLDKLLVENVESAYPHYSFSYDTKLSYKAGQERPDILISQIDKSTSKKVIWHETDEWEHKKIDADKEVFRQYKLAMNIVNHVHNESCQLHLIRCSPYSTPSGHLNAMHTYQSVLDSCRLILDVLDSKQRAADQVFNMSSSHKLYIYYINYSARRTRELASEWNAYFTNFPAAPHNASSTAPPSAAEARQNQAHASGNLGARGYATADASSSQQRPTQHQKLPQEAITRIDPPAVHLDSSLAHVRHSTAAKGAEQTSPAGPVKPSSPAAIGQPSKPKPPRPFKPAEPPSSAAQAEVKQKAGAQPKASTKTKAANHLHTTGQAQATGADLGDKDPLQVMAVCPGCSVSGNYYTKTGDKIQKYFKYIKLDLKPLMTIECCPTCAKPPLPLFASNSMTRYSELKKTLECQELVHQVLDTFATSRFKRDYKGKPDYENLYKSNHPARPQRAQSRTNSDSGAASASGAQAGQQAAAKATRMQPDAATSVKEARQAGILGAAFPAAMQQSSAEGQPTATPAGLPSNKRPHDSMQQDTSDKTASKRAHTAHQSPVLLNEDATSSRQKSGTDPEQGDCKVQQAKNRVLCHCPCCGKDKMFWDAKGIKRFTSNDVGGDAGDSAKINICDVCHRRPARQIFVTGCKDSYKSQRTSRMDAQSVLKKVLEESSSVHADFKKACKDKDVWVENNPTRPS